MFQDDADMKLVKDAMFDPFGYFIARHKDRLLKTDFKAALGRVSYCSPCHRRMHSIGTKAEVMSKRIGQTLEVKSGHAGTYGVKAATHRLP